MLIAGGTTHSPLAFNGSDTILLRAFDVANACTNYEPPHVLIRTASVYHFDIHDRTRTTLNPSPPDDVSKSTLFPPVPAFYDSLIDTHHELYKLLTEHV